MSQRFLVALVLVGAVSGCKRDQAVPAAAAPAPPRPDARLVAAEADASPALPADYDPTVLVERGAAPVEVFLEEPRHPAWAPAVEEVVGGAIRRDLAALVPETRSFAMGCRTLSCLMIIDVPEARRDAALAVASLVTLGPITVNLGLTPEGKAQLLFLTERRMADPAFFTGWYQRTRRRVLDDVRSGKQPNRLPGPPSSVPAE